MKAYNLFFCKFFLSTKALPSWFKSRLKEITEQLNLEKQTADIFKINYLFKNLYL